MDFRSPFYRSRRDVLRSAGTAGGLFGLSQYTATASGRSASGTGSSALDAEIGVDELLDEIIGETAIEIKEDIWNWFEHTLDGIGAIIDEVRELITDSDVLGYVDDLAWYYEYAADIVEDAYRYIDQQSEDEDDPDKPRAAGTRASTVSDSTHGPERAKRSGGPASSTASAAASASGTALGHHHLPSRSDVTGALNDLEGDARGAFESAYGATVGEIMDRMPDLSIGAILDRIVQGLADVVLWSIRNLRDFFGDFVTNPGQMVPFGINIGFPGFSGDLGFFLRTPIEEWTVEDGVDQLTPWEFRDCERAMGRVLAYPLEVEFDLPVVTDGWSISYWAGIEEGRPCAYWGADLDLGGTITIGDLLDENEDYNRDRRVFSTSFEEDLQYHVDGIDGATVGDSDVTFGDLERTVQNLEGIVDDPDQYAEEHLEGDVDASEILDEGNLEDVQTDVDDLRSAIGRSQSVLADTSLIEDLLAIEDTTDSLGIDSPPAIAAIVSTTGGPRIDPADLPVSAPRELGEHRSDLLEWFRGLDTSEYQSLQAETDVDLAAVESTLADRNLPVFDVTDELEAYIRHIVEESFQRLRNELEQVRVARYQLDEHLPDVGCTGRCFNITRNAAQLPVLAPMPVVIAYAVSEWFVDELPDLELPSWAGDAVLVILFLVCLALIVLPEPGTTAAGAAGAVVLAPTLLARLNALGNGEALLEQIRPQTEATFQG